MLLCFQLVGATVATAAVATAGAVAVTTGATAAAATAGATAVTTGVTRRWSLAGHWLGENAIFLCNITLIGCR